jgi:hypothetical protein
MKKNSTKKEGEKNGRTKEQPGSRRGAAGGL